MERSLWFFVSVLLLLPETFYLPHFPIPFTELPQPEPIVISNAPQPIETQLVLPTLLVEKLSVVETPPEAEPQLLPRQKNPYPLPKRLSLSHDSGYGDNSGIGYGSDYSTLGILLSSDYTVGSFYPLIDLRAHRFDNDSYAFNIGIGARYIPVPNSFCEIIGFNTFYDWRQGFLNQYNQLSFGLEILGKRWDFRANGYFPVGAKTYKHTCTYDGYIGDYYIINERREITTYGFNAEVGWLAIASKNFLLYFAAGPYYLTRRCCCFEPLRGGRIRARPQYKDYFALDVSFSHDSNFNTIWETTFIVSLPLYQIANQNEKPCHLSDRQIYQPIERFETMPLGNRSCWEYNY